MSFAAAEVVPSKAVGDPAWAMRTPYFVVPDSAATLLMVIVSGVWLQAVLKLLEEVKAEADSVAPVGLVIPVATKSEPVVRHHLVLWLAPEGKMITTLPPEETALTVVKKTSSCNPLARSAIWRLR